MAVTEDNSTPGQKPGVQSENSVDDSSSGPPGNPSPACTKEMAELGKIIVGALNGVGSENVLKDPTAVEKLLQFAAQNAFGNLAACMDKNRTPTT